MIECVCARGAWHFRLVPCVVEGVALVRYSFRRARAQFPDQDGNKLDVNNHSLNGSDKREENRNLLVTCWASGQATLEKCTVI